MKEIVFSANKFDSIENLTFAAAEYSRLKYGDNQVAKKFGYELADKFFAKHAQQLVMKQGVVIPSPYNFIPNAATIMARHFINRLNYLLVHGGTGKHLEWNIIHRKVSYISDYGFLSREQRKELIDGDQFYLNRDFLKRKLLIFVDDVKITGAHEDKLIEILDKEGIKNDRAFCYFGEYTSKADPAIESRLNGTENLTPEVCVSISVNPDNHLIVRPIKHLLSLSTDAFMTAVAATTAEWRTDLLHAAYGEGYYRIPKYQDNLKALQLITK